MICIRYTRLSRRRQLVISLGATCKIASLLFTQNGFTSTTIEPMIIALKIPVVHWCRITQSFLELILRTVHLLHVHLSARKVLQDCCIQEAGCDHFSHKCLLGRRSQFNVCGLRKPFLSQKSYRFVELVGLFTCPGSFSSTSYNRQSCVNTLWFRSSPYETTYWRQENKTGNGERLTEIIKLNNYMEEQRT